ncbi:MAG: winged helix DNA-binding domain-containing protein [Actinomycetota bacterium]|nr:winged helix DNA-binding domain-containing protein [Actinomycetota bacterium]
MPDDGQLSIRALEKAALFVGEDGHMSRQRAFVRDQVIAYRVAAQGLHRTGRSVGKLAVLDIGVQDASPELARLSFDARLSSPVPADGIGPKEPLALVWSLRGAPHVHLRADLDAVARALYPLSEADATGRLNETGPSVGRAGIPALEQFDLAVDAMRAVVRKPMGKGAASTAVTKRLPDVMGRNCRGCHAVHISDSAMRPAALAAGLELEPGTAPPVLHRRTGSKVVKQVDVRALHRLIKAYLSLLGPATQADVAGYLDARRADVAEVWPDGLEEVSVDGQVAWLPAGQADELTAAPPPEVVRLLSAFDPYLQARDRALIVPDKALHKVLWPVLGRPGAVFVDGEVAGTWRPKSSGKKLTLKVEAFAPLPPSAWKQIEAEAQRVAAVRGAADVTVSRVE